MNSPSQLVAFVVRGYDVSVERRGASRIVRVLNRRGGVRASITLSGEGYEAFMADAMALLAEAHPRQAAIQVKRDFYGRTWAEVRSGLLGQSLARVHVSPRHLTMLQSHIEATARAALAG